jgi:hypothetical protein
MYKAGDVVQVIWNSGKAKDGGVRKHKFFKEAVYKIQTDDEDYPHIVWFYYTNGIPTEEFPLADSEIMPLEELKPEDFL